MAAILKIKKSVKWRGADSLLKISIAAMLFKSARVFLYVMGGINGEALYLY